MIEDFHSHANNDVLCHWLAIFKLCITRPPIQILLSIKSICVMKKGHLLPMNEMDSKFNKISIFSFSILNRTFKISEMLFNSLDVNLQHS